MKTDISVIVPTIGRASLAKCLTSLFNQSILPGEIVVVDNSIDHTTRSIVNQLLANNNKKINIKYIWEKKKGVAYARNAGIKAASYDLAAFIDDDCMADKNWIRNIKDFFSKKSIYLLQGKCLNGLPNDLISCVEHFSTEGFFQSNMYRHEANFIDTKNYAFDKSFIRQFPYFDTRFTHIMEDVDFAVRAKNKGLKIIYQPEIKVRHYGRTNLFSHIKREFFKGRDFYRFQKKWQDRRDNTTGYDKIVSLMEEVRKKKTIIVEKRLKKEILRRKTIQFRIFFYLLLYLDKSTILSGFMFEKLFSANSFTKIFLPRKNLGRFDRSQSGI